MLQSELQFYVVCTTLNIKKLANQQRMIMLNQMHTSVSFGFSQLSEYYYKWNRMNNRFTENTAAFINFEHDLFVQIYTRQKLLKSGTQAIFYNPIKCFEKHVFHFFDQF